MTPTLTLGFWPFSYLGGLTAAPTIATSNSAGPQWSATEIKLGNVQAFGFGLKNVDLKVVSDDTWQGTATLVLPTPNEFGFTVGIGLKNGGLDYLAGGVTGLNISIADGVFLQSITLSGGGSGIPWTGTIGLTAGPQVAGHAAITINGVGELHARATSGCSTRRGNAKLGGHFDLGNADVKYISNGTFMVKGSVDWNAGPGEAHRHDLRLGRGHQGVRLRGRAAGVRRRLGRLAVRATPTGSSRTSGSPPASTST